MTLIYNYIYREVLLLTLTIVGVLTFLLVTLSLYKVVEAIIYTDLSIWLTLKFVLLVIPFTLTMTIPTGLLAAVLIFFGRMSSDRELLALKAAGIGLAWVVAPVVIIATLCSLLNFWLVASVVPECKKESSEMMHEIVTSNPQALLVPEVSVDKIPGWRIYFTKKNNGELENVWLWRLDEQNRLVSSLRAERATIGLDLEHQQMIMTLYKERQEEYPPNGGPIVKVQPGASADQLPVGVSLNSFYEKVEKRLSWMTLPEIEEVISAMQMAPTNELATPYLTEFQARIAFAMSCITFVVVGIPLAIQTQRRETAVGIFLTILIVLFYMVLGAVARALKTKAGLYPEVISWAPNIIFQALGAWLFYRSNRK